MDLIQNLMEKIENMKTESDEENGNEISETECVELDEK